MTLHRPSPSPHFWQPWMLGAGVISLAKRWEWMGFPAVLFKEYSRSTNLICVCISICVGASLLEGLLPVKWAYDGF